MRADFVSSAPMRLLTISLLVALASACSSSADTSSSATSSSSAGVGTGGSGGMDGSGSSSSSSGASGTGGGGGPIAPEGPARYPAGARHSPMSASVVARLKDVIGASPGRKDVFAKVGASNTVNTHFATCFAGADVDLGAHAELEPSRAFFATTLADPTHTSFDRVSLAAKVGWGAAALLAGDPPPLDQEIDAIDPGFAVVLLGTNDTYAQGVVPFEASLLAVVDHLLSRGVVPLVSTLPPRADSPEAAALAPEMNQIIRAVAQARQVPFMDLFGALDVLPDKGLVSDGIHLGVYSQGGAHGCWLNEAGLAEGMNQRNLITLEALDRARRFLLESAAPEAAPPALAGKGTWEDPLVIDALPFVDDRDTNESTTSVVSAYSCGPQDEGGPEIVYRLTVNAQTKLRARVFDGGGVDVDLHLLGAEADGESCIARADKLLDADVGPGTYWIAVDSYVSGGAAQSGPYRLTVIARP